MDIFLKTFGVRIAVLITYVLMLYIGIEVGTYMQTEQLRQVHTNIQLCSMSRASCIQQLGQCEEVLKEAELRELCKALEE